MKLLVLFSALWCTYASAFFKEFQFTVILEPQHTRFLLRRIRTLLVLNPARFIKINLKRFQGYYKCQFIPEFISLENNPELRTFSFIWRICVRGQFVETAMQTNINSATFCHSRTTAFVSYCHRYLQFVYIKPI